MIESPPLQPADTFTTIAKIVADLLEVDLARVTKDATFDEALGGDPLDRHYVINEVEIKFDILLADEALAFATVGALADAVDEEIKNRSALHAGASEGLQ